ncbi:GCN5-related N-acetyltransferase [Bacillus methanolicus PB1]|uniref:GCN5-related N-acetyltransferase n=1 Tax=Bacillus methanolicus PB1 TaxID=997296 RepID=I3E6L7_BACMT|nr:GNAT family N-acetyltransferase [Bacillus methanolicus]EIJ82138.1 GCN5-related N-acetyltransferase [Bacillus methanolicus PB1]
MAGFIKEINILDEDTAKHVLSLQLEAYRIEADLIGTMDIPPLKDSLQELMVCGEEFVGFFEQEELIGATSYKVENGQLDIHRLMVKPGHFRKGIARKLLNYLEKANPEVHEMIVSTGAANLPAVQLYQKLGFKKTGEQKTKEGIFLVQFKKTVLISKKAGKHQ